MYKSITANHIETIMSNHLFIGISLWLCTFPFWLIGMMLEGASFAKEMKRCGL